MMSTQIAVALVICLIATLFLFLRSVFSTAVTTPNYQAVCPTQPMAKKTSTNQTSNSQETILVTGAFGALGRFVIKELVETQPDEIQIIAADIQINPDETIVPPRLRISHHKRVKAIHCDVTDRDAVSQLFADTQPTTVVHLAAIVPRAGWRESDYMRINVGGTCNVVDACVMYDVQNFMFISSISAILPKLTKDTDLTKVPKLTSDAAYTQASLYGTSKEYSEKLIRDRLTKTNTRFSIIRLPTLIGYGCMAMEVATMSASFTQILMRNGIEHIIDFVHCKDVAKSIIKIDERLRNADEVVNGSTYNLGGIVCHLSEIYGPTDPATKRMTMGCVKDNELSWFMFNLIVSVCAILAEFRVIVPDMKNLSLEVIETCGQNWAMAYDDAVRDFGYEPTMKKDLIQILEELKEDYKSVGRLGYVG